MIKLELQKVKSYLTLRSYLIIGSVLLGLICIFGYLVISKKSEVKALLSDALTSYKSNDLPKAKGLMLRVIEVDSSNPEAYFLLGKIEYYSKNFSDSLVSFENCVSSDPKRVDCMIWKAKAIYLVGKDVKAFDKAVNEIRSMGIESPEVFHLDGLRYELTGKLDKAIESYNRAVDMSSAISPTLIRLEEIYTRAGFKSKANKFHMLNEAIIEYNDPSISRR
ncbi:tetratricopeptide repeat protein [Leptospira andrefontaineae]|uniref:Uncharacterized protein n=1 Tax=Leptospira andrefontaineae TaxID=2484976 RepID=A0A4V3JG87_9LEPT|nr:hypothetical protein [Leptospira andrefontaineae]TGK41262.1 hypothetical protein EHO65_07495 [Leptospira andrefontaineae]